MKENVLIFPAGTEIGLEINNALKYSPLLRVFGGTSTKDHTEYMYKNYIDGIPFIKDEKFLKVFNGILQENHIDYVYPAHDSVQLFLTQNLQKIKSEVITSHINTVEICRLKGKTYKYFKDDFFIPVVYKNMEMIEDYPVFIKPDVGQGSQGAVLIKNPEELKNQLSKKIKFVICEYLPGEEYTVDCFTDKYEKLRVVKLRNRARIKTGISVNSKILPLNKSIIEIANTINRKLSFNGAWFFQVKKNSAEEYRLMEISPRIPGTMGVSRNLGINFPLLTIYNAMGRNIEIIENNLEIEVDRAFINRYKTDLEFDTVYVSLEDTLILNESRVNIFLIMFLYQQINKNKKIVLLTKDKDFVTETLEKFKISEGLFNNIINVASGHKKSDYIKEKNSIMIEAYFSERMEVKRRHGIAVFDLDSVESLIDWRI